MKHPSSQTAQMTEIDLALTSGAAELQRLRDRRAKPLSVRINIVPTATGMTGGGFEKLAQTLRRTVGGRAPAVHRRDRVVDARLHASVILGDVDAVAHLLKGSAHRQLNVRQGADAQTPLHLVLLRDIIHHIHFSLCHLVLCHAVTRPSCGGP